MAIQNRRGNIVDLDPYKLLPGEFGISLDNKKAQICFEPGVTKTMATEEDFQVQLDAINTNIARAEAAAIAAESLVVNKAGINDLAATLTEAYSGIKTEQLFNDAKTYASGLFAGVTSFKIQVVASLPTTDIQAMTIYLVPKAPSATDNYDEYMYIDSQWEHIGSTELDLSSYYTKAEVNNQIGDRSLLPTPNTDLVGAVNEVSSEIGSLNNLPTIDKSNLVNALLEVNSNLDLFDETKVSKNNIAGNVKDYGAKGDGVTDDTQAFINALSAHKSVYVPFSAAGYVVGSLTLNDSQSLIGDEQKTIIKLTSGTNWITVHGTNITVKNFRILANNMTGALFLLDTLNITCTYLYFQNIFAYQATTILKDNGGTNQITSLYIKNITSSLQKGDAYILTKAEAFTFFENVTVDYATAGGSNNSTAFHMTNNNGSIFKDCDVLGSASDGSHTNQIGYIFDTCQAIWLIRCMADTMDGYGFYIKGLSKYFYFTECVGSACSAHQFFLETGTDIKFTNCYAGGRKGLLNALVNQDAINMQSGCNKVIISASRITNCTRDGLRSDGAAFINANTLQIDSNGGYAIRSTGSSTGLYSNIMSLGNTSGNYNLSGTYEYIRNMYKGDATMVDSVNGANIG